MLHALSSALKDKWFVSDVLSNVRNSTSIDNQLIQIFILTDMTRVVLSANIYMHAILHDKRVNNHPYYCFICDSTLS